MSPAPKAILATKSENSLACPNRKPTSFATLSFSLERSNNHLKHKGFKQSISSDNKQAGTTIWVANPKLKVAPTEKKNMTRKKSRKGFKLSAIKSEIGLAAKATPA